MKERLLSVSLAGSASQEAEGLLLSLHTSLTWWHSEPGQFLLSFASAFFPGSFFLPDIKWQYVTCRVCVCKTASFTVAGSQSQAVIITLRKNVYT